MDGSHHSHLFAKNAYVYKFYQIYSKRKSGGGLELLSQEFRVP